MVNNKLLLNLYTDYLISASGQTTATGLSALLNSEVSHDQIQRMLASKAKTAPDLWRVVKPYSREIESLDGILIIDDSIAEKPYTDENDIICWHYDHAKKRNVKGINFVSCLYHNKGISLPIGFELVHKTEYYINKEGKEKRRSKRSKNEMFRDLLFHAKRNQVQFRYVLSDIWYSSAENMKFIKHKMEKDFVMPLKSNRKIAISCEAKRQGRYQRVDTLELELMKPITIYLEGVDFPLLLVKQIFIDKNGKSGIWYLVTSNTTLNANEIVTIYQKRWKVECYHKSLKQNVSLEKSPTQTVTTQTNHLFASLCGYIKLELLKSKTKLNHFALKSRLYLQALQSAYAALQELCPVTIAA